MQFSWCSPAVPVLISEASPIRMSIEDASMLCVIPAIVGIVCSPMIGNILDAIGRKPIVLLIALLQAASWIIVARADSFAMLCVARVLVGLTDAGTYTCVPIYVAETVEAKHRGSLGSVIAIAIYAGQFVINILGAYSSITVTALSSLAFPLVLLVSYTYLPETPYYLLSKGKEEEAYQALRKLRANVDVEEEMLQIKGAVERQMSEPARYADLFSSTSNRKALLFAMGVRLAHQLSGITAFTHYTQYIFGIVGGDVSPSTSAILFSGIQMFAVLFSPHLAVRYGRRTLMIFSCLGCAISLAIEAIYFYFDVELSPIKWVSLASMLAYIAFFCAGLGIVPSLVLSEVFSASVKGKAVSFMFSFFAALVLLSSKTFQVAVQYCGMFAPFCFFAIACFLNVLVCYGYMPETEGKTLEEIQQMLKTKHTRSYKQLQLLQCCSQSK